MVKYQCKNLTPSSKKLIPAWHCFSLQTKVEEYLYGAKDISELNVFSSFPAIFYIQKVIKDNRGMTYQKPDGCM